MKAGDKVLIRFKGWCNYTYQLSEIKRETKLFWIVEDHKYYKKNLIQLDGDNQILEYNEENKKIYNLFLIKCKTQNLIHQLDKIRYNFITDENGLEHLEKAYELIKPKKG